MTLDEQFKQREASASLLYIRLRDIRFDSAIPGRPIDWKYVEQLKTANVHQLPMLDVMWVANDNYYEFLDGQHRWWSIVEVILQRRAALLPAVAGNSANDYARYLKACLAQVDDTIQARVWPEMPAHEVQLVRFWKNRDHGLGASDIDRKEMAITLKNINPLLTIEQIAHEVRRSNSFVSKALNETVREEKEKAPDSFKDTRKFCDMVERLYSNGFFEHKQIKAREEWLRDDTQFRKAYEEIARQMLREVDRARK